MTSPAKLVPTTPSLARHFSKLAGRYKRLTTTVLLISLVLVALSAVSASLRPLNFSTTVSSYTINLATGIAAVLLALAGLIRITRLIYNPDRLWRDSRALAEKTRSLTWIYAVGGNPYSVIVLTPAQADDKFGEDLQSAFDEARAVRVPVKLGKSIQIITLWMQQTRSNAPQERLDEYLTGRIGKQYEYYEDRAAKYQSAAAIAQGALVAIELLGAMLAALNALGWIQLDLVGVAGTVAAGVVAWTQFNQYTVLAATYEGMRLKLEGLSTTCNSIRTQLEQQSTWNEAEWADYVRKVEDTLAAENGSWRQFI